MPFQRTLQTRKHNMFPRYLATITCLYVVTHMTTATPLMYPRAYNQGFVAPNDINDLEEDHVKRALSDVSTTIKEVQKLLETDPSLPRLTTGEIEELFENVTKQEFEKSLRKGDRDRAKHMRALMLVLPFNTNNNSDLQELYTRAPITRVINSDVKPQKFQKIVVQPDDVDPYTSNKNATTYKPALQIKPDIQRPVTQRPVIQQLDIQRPTTFHPKSPKLPNPTETFESSLTTTTTILPVKNSVSSHYTDDKPLAPLKVQTPIRENVKDLLQAIGLTQELEPTTTPKPEMTQELKELLQSFGLLTNEEPPKYLTTVEPIQEQFEPVVSSLLRDEPVAIEEFKPIPYKTRSNYRMNTGPELTSYDFQAFKPLPIPEDGPISSDMEEFLRSFGLFDGNFRGKKSMDMDDAEGSTESSFSIATEKPGFVRMEKMPEVNVDFLAPDLVSVLENIGITNTNTNRGKSYDHGFSNYDSELNENINRRSDENIGDNSAEKHSNGKVTMKLKANHQNISDEDFTKLQHLLETIKKLDKLNANLTDEEIESLNLSNFNLSESFLAQQLNPNENVEFDETKNEVKRQSAETTDSPNPFRFTLDLQVTTEESHESGDFLNLTSAATTSATPLTTTETSTTTTSTEEPRRSSDLDDSFGGLDPVAEEPLPTPRRNGFYFLADWNSFLEVGEDPDKVIVRFDPKVGDPSRFLPVTVP